MGLFPVNRSQDLFDSATFTAPQPQIDNLRVHNARRFDVDIQLAEKAEAGRIATERQNQEERELLAQAYAAPKEYMVKETKKNKLKQIGNTLKGLAGVIGEMEEEHMPATSKGAKRAVGAAIIAGLVSSAATTSTVHTSITGRVLEISAVFQSMRAL